MRKNHLIIFDLPFDHPAFTTTNPTIFHPGFSRNLNWGTFNWRLLHWHWIYPFGHQVFTFLYSKNEYWLQKYSFFFNIFEVSIQFDCIKCDFLVPKWIDSFWKSVYIDDSDWDDLENWGKECKESRKRILQKRWNY